jgi:lipoprotein-releasing system ATP-binding protein
MNNTTPVLVTQQLSKTFHDGTSLITVLKEINLSIAAGEKVAIMGTSGSGKSTLLHLLGGLDKPTHGSVHLAGKNINEMSQNVLSKLRGQQLGFVYQFHHLLPELNAVENVALPAIMAGDSVETAQKKASDLLTQVELQHRFTHRPAQLSGGERQRVAIARALVNRPLCVMADEPTGNLDRQTAEHIHTMIDRLNKELNISFLIATHDPSWAAQMHRVLNLRDGVLI